MSNYFTYMDYLVFGTMLLISALVGVYFALFAKEKQNTTSQYLFGGKTTGVFPISMSLVASYISGISLLGIPAEMYVYGSVYWMVVFSEMLITVAMYYIYIPVFYKLQITSSYEYLNLRFGRNVRTLGSCLFILKMLLYIPLVIYVPALAFSQVTGINLHMVTPIVCSICIFYTTLGGLKAVVWTDTIQMVVMIGAMVAVIVIGTAEIGISNIFERNMNSGRIEFFVFDTDLTIRNTFWSLIVGNFFLHTASCTVNQAMVQRCLAMPTKEKANLTVINLGIGIVLLVSMCCYTGLMVFAQFYDCDPLSVNKIHKSDQILPYYILEIGNVFPGLPGLFVSGVFSAALSTMSTGLNSLTGIIFHDILFPFTKDIKNEATSSLIMKLIVVVVGIFCTAMVFLVEHLGALIQAAISLSGITAGPLLGLFSLGMFFPWANEKGAIAGGICSIISVAYISGMSQAAQALNYITFPTKPFSVEGCNGLFNMSTPLINESLHSGQSVFWIFRIASLWYTFIGVLIVITVGLIVSYCTGFTDSKTLDKDLLTPVIHRFFTNKEDRHINKGEQHFMKKVEKH